MSVIVKTKRIGDTTILINYDNNTYTILIYNGHNEFMYTCLNEKQANDIVDKIITNNNEHGKGKT